MTATENGNGAVGMKAQVRKQIAHKLRSEAISRLTVAMRQAHTLMGDDFVYEWLAGQMNIAEDRIAKMHAELGLTAPETEETAAKLQDLLAEAESDRDAYRAKLLEISRMDGAASMVAALALGEPVNRQRVADVMERPAIDDEEMRQPAQMMQ